VVYNQDFFQRGLDKFSIFFCAYEFLPDFIDYFLQFINLGLNVSSFWVLLEEAEQIADGKKSITALVQDSKCEKVNHLDGGVESLFNSLLILAKSHDSGKAKKVKEILDESWINFMLCFCDYSLFGQFDFIQENVRS
jgi:hypothetical protein